MRVIIERFWNEPSVVIGLGFSVVLFFVMGGFNTPQDAIAIFGPFVSSLGIRQFTTPTYGSSTPKDEGNQRPEDAA